MKPQLLILALIYALGASLCLSVSAEPLKPGEYDLQAGDYTLRADGQVTLISVHGDDRPLPDPDPIPDPEPDPVPPKPQTGNLPKIEILDYPYYSERQTDIVERVCGPLGEWEVRDLFTDEDVEKQRGFGAGDRIIFRTHYKPTPYPALSIKGISCALVEGVLGNNGQKPIFANVNATRSRKAGTRQGGVMLSNIRVSQYDAYEAGDKSAGGGDCLGMPNDQQFYIIKDSEIDGCWHRSLITSGAYGLYFEAVDSKFSRSYSHNLYIDSVAYAYIENVTSDNPGWGHALRCIAGKCIIKNTRVSNVDLQTGLPVPRTRPDGKRVNPIGMHPLEFYNCGSGHVFEDGEINFYRQDGNRDSAMASHFRTRDAKWGCNLASHDGKEWNVPDFGSQAWKDAEFSERTLTYRNVKVNCIGDKPCYALTTWGSHPIGSDEYRAAIQGFNRDRQKHFGVDWTWERMMSILENGHLGYSGEMLLETASRVLPWNRERFLQGKSTNKMPAPVHPSVGFRELGRVTLENVTGENLIDLVRPTEESTFYCWTGTGDNCPDRMMPAAVVD